MCRCDTGEAMPEIGLVRLGRMGVPICANLVRAGYGVRAGDRRPEAAEQAARCGARWVPQLVRLAAGADVLITVLPGAGEVRELMLGAGVTVKLTPLLATPPAAVTTTLPVVAPEGTMAVMLPALTRIAG